MLIIFILKLNFIKIIWIFITKRYLWLFSPKSEVDLFFVAIIKYEIFTDCRGDLYSELAFNMICALSLKDP